MALTKLQKRFADEYLIDLNAIRAYRDTYKNCKKDETARENSSKMLEKPNIITYISKKYAIAEKINIRDSVKESLLKQLKRKGEKIESNFVDLIEDYMMMWDIKERFKYSIEENGTLEEYEDILKINRQMLSILKQLGITVESKEEDACEL